VTTRVLLFVCPHGAGKSRIAAAWFNQLAPTGWRALSAGLEPQAQLGDNAPRLVAGTLAEAHLDRTPPRSIADAGSADRIVAIDCDVPGAERWNLSTAGFTDELAEEIRVLVVTLLPPSPLTT
jgi:protein-tyrosine-phosphatase